MCKLHKQLILSGVMLLGISSSQINAGINPNLLLEGLEEQNLIRHHKSQVADYDKQAEKSQGAGQKQSVHQYYEKHPELLEKASKNLPKQIPLYKWVSEFSENDPSSQG